MSYYNDGDYSNKTLDGACQHLTQFTNKCFREYVPFKENDITYLKITHDQHDVNLINKNFLNITATMKITPKTDLTFETREYKMGKTADDIAADEGNNYANVLSKNITKGDIGRKMYIGWKNSSEIIQEMTVLNNNKETGYQQVHADRENYLESIKFKTRTEKDIYRDCHFAYENYYNGYEGEVPGLLIANNLSLNTNAPETKSVALISTPKDYQIYPLSDAFIAAFPAMNMTKNTWINVGQSLLQEIIHRSAPNTEPYREWIDFALNYDYTKGGTANSKYLNVNGDQFNTLEELCADYIKEINAATTEKREVDKKKVPQIKDAKAITYTFIIKQVFKWATNSPITAEISMIIPLKDLPAFNSMEIFERPFGDITLKLMFGYRSMMIFTGDDKCMQYDDSNFNVSDFTITNLTCQCYGYNVGSIKDSGDASAVWADLKTKFGADSDRARIYECRFTDFKNFDGNMQGGRFNIEFPYGLEMVKYIHMTFPRKSNQYTVFRNPMLKDVKLKLDGILYPREENIRTDNRLFYHMQILDYEYDDDVRYSYTCPVLNSNRTDKLKDSEKKEELDDSDFIITWQLSIGPFMGVHRYSDNLNINFTAEIINYIKNMYGVKADGTDYKNDEPSPQIWFTHDSCWRLNFEDGLVFMKNVCPSYDLYKGNGQDVFYMHG